MLQLDFLDLQLAHSKELCLSQQIPNPEHLRPPAVVISGYTGPQNFEPEL